jgi:hypothetical protein
LGIIPFLHRGLANTRPDCFARASRDSLAESFSKSFGRFTTQREAGTLEHCCECLGGTGLPPTLQAFEAVLLDVLGQLSGSVSRKKSQQPLTRENQSLRGSPGQGSHVSSNTEMDNLHVDFCAGVTPSRVENDGGADA